MTTINHYRDQVLILNRAANAALKKEYDKAGLIFDERTIAMHGPAVPCVEYEHYKNLMFMAQLNSRLLVETDDAQLHKLRLTMRKLAAEIRKTAAKLAE